MSNAKPLKDAERVVIKFGSLLMYDENTQAAHHARLWEYGQDIAMLRNEGKQVIVVTSGAVTLGRPLLELEQPELTLREKQAAAACGQIELAKAWQRALEVHDLRIAPLLITGEDTENRRRYLNMRDTIATLLDHGIIPVINENDFISTQEIRYGDNDRLAARVAAMASADLLVLLSDIDGLYTANPKENPDAKLIPVIEELSDEIDAMAGESLDHRSSGGMKTKLEAARIATSSGCAMIIAPGMQTRPIEYIAKGGQCSLFTSDDTPLSARKHWIANPASIRGHLHIDSGAEKALSKGRSLLPPGITKVEGDFVRGDTVSVMTPTGEELARGLAGFSAAEIELVAGQHSDEIISMPGYNGRREVIHRDDMVLLS